MSDSIKDFLERSITITERVYSDISKSRGAYVDKITEEYVEKNGVLMNRDEYFKNFIVENYDIFVLKSFILLMKEVIDNTENNFITFVFRVIQEVGITKIDVCFADGILENDKKKFKLENSLSDWLTLHRHDNYKNNFIDVFTNNKDLLDDKIRILFDKAKESLLANNDVTWKLIRKIGVNLSRNIGTYSLSKEQNNFLLRSNVDALKVMWSQCLHGNPFAIEMVFKQTSPNRLKNRANAIMFLSIMNVLYRIRNKISDGLLLSETKKILEDGEIVWKELESKMKIQ